MTEPRTFAVVGGGLAGGEGRGDAARRGLRRPDRPVRRRAAPPLRAAAAVEGLPAGQRRARHRLRAPRPTWYAEHDVDLRLGTAGHRRSTGTRTSCMTDDGQPVHYDKLLLATGSVAAPPAVARRRPAAACTTCAPLDDADALRAAVRPGANVVVVGGGLDRPGDRGRRAQRRRRRHRRRERRAPAAAACSAREMAQVFADLHREHGVDLRLGVTVGRHRGATVGRDRRAPRRRRGVDGRRGRRRRRRHARTSSSPGRPGWTVDNGVLVDARLRTSDPRHLRRRRRRQRRAPAARDAGSGSSTGPTRSPAGRSPRRSMLGQDAVVRPTAVLLHRPVRPRHGVRRLRRAPTTTVVVRGDLDGGASSSRSGCATAGCSPG